MQIIIAFSIRNIKERTLNLRSSFLNTSTHLTKCLVSWVNWRAVMAEWCPASVAVIEDEPDSSVHMWMVLATAP